MKASRDKFYSDFDPRVPAGCALWLDGADSNAMTLSGSDVTVWKDKSGSGYNASQATAINQPTFDGSGIVFNGTSAFLQITNPAIRPTNAYVVVNTTGGIRNLITKGFSTGVGDLEYSLRAGSTSVNVRYVNSADTLSSNAYTGISDTTLIETTWDDTTVNLYTNGVSQSSSALAGPQKTVTTGATDMRIGAAFSDTDNASTPTSFYAGTIYEIIMYSNALTTSNRQAVEGYLARKWGILSNLPTTHAFKTYAPFARPMIPPDLGNSENWFDAADVDTITSSGGIVSEWKNKGVICRAFEATVNYGSPTTGAVSQNGLNCIGMAVNDILQHQDVAVNFTTQPRAHFFASRPTMNTTAAGANTIGFKFQGLTASSGNDCILFYNGGRLLELAQGVQFTIETNAIANQQNVFGVYTFVNAATTANNRIALDGSSIPLITSVVASGYNQSNSLSNYINGLQSPPGNIGAQDLGEWVGFRSELLPANVQKMEGYLAWKWGNRASMPAAHPYKNFPQLAVAFNPLMFGNCGLWLDAMDASSVVVSSGAVSAWLDKSGNNRHVTQATAGNRPTYVATNLQDPYLQFSAASSQFLDLSDAANLAVGRSFSVFLVEDRTSSTGALNFFIGGTSGNANSNLVLGYYNDTLILMAFLNNDLAYTLPQGFAANSDIRIWDYVYTKPGREIWIDGIMRALDTNATDLQAWAGATIGRYSTTYYDGIIRELLWYTPALTSNERSMVEGYLAHKWNRKGALSFGHPFKKVIP